MVPPDIENILDVFSRLKVPKPEFIPFTALDVLRVAFDTSIRFETAAYETGVR
jgi:hypothetical protein